MKNLLISGLLLFVITTLNAQDVVYDNPNGSYTLTNTVFNGNVTVKPLTTVIIPSGVIVKLKSWRTFFIDTGAKLIVNGRIEYDNSDNSIPYADRYYNGIFVAGKESYRSPGIEAVLSGGYPWGNPSSNGVLIVDGGVISGGRASIMSFNGGIIYVNNSLIEIFRDYGITFDHGDNLKINSIPTLGIIQNSIIINSESNGIGNTGVFGQAVHGIKIGDCQFINELSSSTPSEAIVSINSGIIINNCDFENFHASNHLAVKTEIWANSIRGYMYVRNCGFYNCRNGVILRGTEISEISGNQFYCPTSGESVGILIGWSNSFTIKGNTFLEYGKYYSELGYKSKAIDVIGSGDMGSMIRNNSFIDCTQGVIITDDNRGLQLRCNSFDAPNMAASVNFTSRVMNTSIPTNKQGISDQGSNFASDYQGIYLPGNIFSQLCSGVTPSECDFTIFDPHPTIKYYYFNTPSPSNLNLTKPEYYSSSYLTPIQSYSANLEIRDNTCAILDYNYGELLNRMEEASGLIANLSPYLETDTIRTQVNYLTDFIESENAEVFRTLLDSSEEGVAYNYLLNCNSDQCKLWFAGMLMDDEKYDSAQWILSQMEIDDEESVPYLEQQFLQRIATHFGSGNHLGNFASEDLLFFEYLAGSYSPISYRAEKLLEAINEEAENLTTATNHLWPNHEYKKKLRIEPNPVNGFIYLDSKLVARNYKVIDITGRDVLSGETNSNMKINLEEILPGLYYLILFDVNGQNHTGKFLKTE